MSREKKESEPIKVTDKRIFTPDGDIREEFKANVTPVDPASQPRPTPPPEAPKVEPEKKKSVREKGANPGTPFTLFLESLVLQAYMSLGMLRDPYGQVRADMNAARQLIDIVTMLSEKTKGNLTEEEEEYLSTHVGELKLAFVQRGKTL